MRLNQRFRNLGISFLVHFSERFVRSSLSVDPIVDPLSDPSDQFSPSTEPSHSVVSGSAHTDVLAPCAPGIGLKKLVELFHMRGRLLS